MPNMVRVPFEELQTELEDKLAEAILNGEIKEGDRVEVGISKKEIKFYTNTTNE